MKQKHQRQNIVSFRENKPLIYRLVMIMNFFNFLIIINSHLMSLFKTKASSLAKIAALPRIRSPYDLYNQPHLAYDIQAKQISGQLEFSQENYYSQLHFDLVKDVAVSRNAYRTQTDLNERQLIADKQYLLWDNYLYALAQDQSAQLSQEQKQHIFEAILTAKQRSQQRLALNRFVKFGYEYSQVYKVDFPLNPVVMMRLVHPHFGYLNNFPGTTHYKYNYEQIFKLIQEATAASLIRQKGHTLHSSELLSFIFWKIATINKAHVNKDQFCEIMKIFKFKDITSENINTRFGYSIKQGELLPSEDSIRFDLFRQIFLDRGL